MELDLHRVQLDPDVTIGSLSIDGKFECWVCEDVVRPAGAPKVYGETAIPAGRYQVVITLSPRFGLELPLLLNVPNFTGVRIHVGNDAKDTDGCLLVGQVREPKGVGMSRAALDALVPKIRAVLDRHLPVFITIH